VGAERSVANGGCEGFGGMPFGVGWLAPDELIDEVSFGNKYCDILLFLEKVE